MNKQLVCKNLLVSYSEEARKDFFTTILFLHGWRSSKDVWRGVVLRIKDSSFTKVLADKKGLRIYALDFPGFGGSQMPPRAMTVGDYANMVAEFIKKLDLKNVIIVGHSFGGRVGIKLAAVHPELTGKLVLVDSAGFAMEGTKKSLMGAAAKIVKPFFKAKFMQPFRRKIYKQIGAEDYLATPELQKTFVNVVGEDLTEDMKKIKCLTLIINGENDQDTTVEFGKRMQSLIPKSRFQIIPNAGHFSFIDQPEEFISLISNFIKQ